jgi:ElaB/YqjD/DUF883 family membrane-anchored ribosome-binding protein
MREFDEMGNSEELVVRTRGSLAESRAVRFRERLDRSKARLREAVTLVKESAREMTPAAQIESNPVAWVMGGLALGLALGWLTASRRPAP